jgi:hypothetical protein
MMLRSSAILAGFALSAVGCGSTEVDFEPLNEAGSVSNAGSAGAPANASGGQASSATGGITAGGAGAGGAPNGGAPMVLGGTGGSSAGASSAGAGGSEANACAALVGWQGGPFQLGQRVLSTCLSPYNGACPVSETHEFECQPPTGAVGLGWCTDRQPGVVNGWSEAWIMHGVCPAAL